MPIKDPILRAQYAKEYREKNREALSEKDRAYREANSEKLKERKREDYLRNSYRYKERAKASRLANLDKIKAYRSTPEYKEKKNAQRRERYKKDAAFRQSILDGQKELRETKGDEINARRAERRAENPEIYRERSRKWREENRDKVLESKRNDYQKHKEQYRETQTQYYKNNKAKWKPYWDKKEYWLRKFHRALTRANTKQANIIDRESIREFYRQVFSKADATCEYCRGVFPVKAITIDHKTPYSLNGNHEVSNLAISCLQCNLEKGETPYEKWRAI